MRISDWSSDVCSSDLNAERIGNTTRSLALGRFAFNMAREHVRTRHQFGRPLMDFQGIQWKFADMQIALDAGQLLLSRPATTASNGLPSAPEPSHRTSVVSGKRVSVRVESRGHRNTK